MVVHLSLSIPDHSLTVISQKPRRNASEEDVDLTERRIPASSEARACCTSGLSDIQKPEDECQYNHSTLLESL